MFAYGNLAQKLSATSGYLTFMYALTASLPVWHTATKDLLYSHITVKHTQSKC